MARKKGKYFQFNLLPEKSKVLVEIEAERDDSLVYSIILVFFSLLVFFLLLLTRSLVIEPRLDEANQLVLVRQNQIESFNDIQSQNGELVQKGITLKAILKKDLEAQEIFRVADEISNIDSNVSVVNYTREQSGLFVFEFLADNLNKVVALLQKAQNLTGVSKVFLRNVSVSKNGRVLISMELKIDNV